jgi:hypothetical protein
MAFSSGKLISFFSFFIQYVEEPIERTISYGIFFFWGGGGYSLFVHFCFICRPLDSTVPTDAGIEPRTVGALAVRRSNH